MSNTPSAEDVHVVHQLSIEHVFQSLSPQEKLYAHYLSRAAWHGSRIILRQTSPEAVAIFDLILDVHRACNGDWQELKRRCKLSSDELEAFLEYAALFLCNLGNYYVCLSDFSYA